jgi:hypothetical protein
MKGQPEVRERPQSGHPERQPDSVITVDETTDVVVDRKGQVLVEQGDPRRVVAVEEPPSADGREQRRGADLASLIPLEALATARRLAQERARRRQHDDDDISPEEPAPIEEPKAE